MKKMEQLRKKIEANKGNIVTGLVLGACVSAYIGISIWEHNHLKTVDKDEWLKMTGEGVYDVLEDKPIADLFATVIYDDGEIGVIHDLKSVAMKLAEQTGIDITKM